MKTKTTLFAALAIMLSTVAPSMAQSASGSQSGASNRNEINVISGGTTIPDRQTIRSAPGIAGGGASSVLSCKGLGTAGLTIIGGGGLLPVPMSDEECERRQFVIQAGSLYQVTGQQRYLRAADAALCDSKVGSKAMSAGGTACPSDTRGGQGQAKAARDAERAAARDARRAAPVAAPAGRRGNAAPAQASTAGMSAQEKRAAGLSYDPTVGQWR